jgi:hypothetical protein
VSLFFFALVCIQAFRKSQKGRFKSEAKKYMGMIRELVDGGAINLPHKLFLLEAEWASLTMKDDQQEILRMYEKASFSASRAGFLQDGALSNILCAQHCLRQGNGSSAGTYLVQSYSLYSSWGAYAVAARIKQEHGDHFPAGDDKPHFEGSTYRSRTQFQQSFSKMHKSLSRARSLGLEEARRGQALATKTAMNRGA